MHLKGRLLKKNSDFLEVYRQGQSLPSRYCVLYFLDVYEHNTKVGISVSKRVGNSVVRHRMKRLYKEIFRLNYNQIKPNIHLVIIVRKGAVSHTFNELQRDFLYLLKKTGLKINKSRDKHDYNA